MKKSGSQKHNKKTVGMTAKEEHFFVKEASKPVYLRRKLTYVTTDVAVTGNLFQFGILTAGVTSCTEWANLSANYQQYRVRAMRCRIVPRQRDNMNSSALIWYPGTVVSGKYPSGSGASTVAGIFAEDGSRIHPEWSVMDRLVTWESNPDAKLWTDCNATIPALSSYGVQFLGTVVGPVSYNTLATHDVFTEFDVEFAARN